MTDPNQYPPPYGQPVPGPGAPNHPQGTTILVLGILSLVVCSPLGIAAWVMGKKALDESRTYHFANEGIIKAGYICGIIGTLIMIAGIVLLIGLVAAGGLMSAGV